MIAAHFVDGPVGLAQGHDKIMRVDPNQKYPPGVKPVRRIVVMDREPNKSCIVQEGELVLVLDTHEVRMNTGDFAVIRGSNHAWSNRSDRPAVVAIATHDGAE
jgi:uncharacterized cupin superfamily protein